MLGISQVVSGGGMNWKKVGTWWGLPWYGKVIRWLRYVPWAYIHAIIFVYPVWRTNEEDLSLKISFILLLRLWTKGLDQWWQLGDE